MSYMFYNSQFDQSIGNWTVSRVTDMSYMFYNSQFDQSIDDWENHIDDRDVYMVNTFVGVAKPCWYDDDAQSDFKFQPCS